MVLTAQFEAALERAQLRAAARHTEARLVAETRAGFDSVQFFRVGSFSQPGVEHAVRLTYTAAGIDTLCDCEAGLNGRVCAHVAAALEAVEASTEPEPTQPRGLSLAEMFWLEDH